MKLEIKSDMRHGYRVVKAVAVSKDHTGKRRQKTWAVRTVAPEYAVNEMEKSFRCEAQRWEARITTPPPPKAQEQELTVAASRMARSETGSS